MPRGRICVVCQVRSAWHLNNMACRKCASLTAAEGTREKYGLPKAKRNKAAKNREFLNAYNKMISEGKLVREIAQHFGMQYQTLKNKIGELRKAGMDVKESLNRPVPTKVPGEPVARKYNDHGGGKTGVTGCDCAPCLTKRRERNSSWAKANREKINAYQRQWSKNRKAKPS